MYQLILVRHGQSEWNKLNQFTGWTDVDLSSQGVEEAMNAGVLMKKHKLNIRYAFTSVLKRAVKTCNLALEQQDRHWVPVSKCWELNERHYGGLQGKNKQQMRDEFGEEQVHIWRRSYDVLPPQLEDNNEMRQAELAHYQKNIGIQPPRAESLKDTVERIIPFWDKVLSKALKQNECILVAAHGNSLRALIKHLQGISDDKIVELEIPTGSPMVLSLDSDFKFKDIKYLD